jgi:hypothetical protein
MTGPPRHGALVRGMQTGPAMKRLARLALAAVFVRCVGTVGDDDPADPLAAEVDGALHHGMCNPDAGPVASALNACFQWPRDGGFPHVMTCIEAACGISADAGHDAMEDAVHQCLEHACAFNQNQEHHEDGGQQQTHPEDAGQQQTHPEDAGEHPEDAGCHHHEDGGHI